MQAVTSPQTASIGSVFSPHIGQNVYYRAQSMDFAVYKQVFLHDEYDLPIDTPDVILDLGAHVGFASLFFAKKYPKATIYSVEPQPENYQLLLKNTKDHPNIIPLNYAIWSEDKPLQLSVPTQGPKSYWDFQVNETAGNADHFITVDGISIQSLIQRFDIDRIGLLKIDIEGSEKELFEHSERWIGSVDAMIIELHENLTPGCDASYNTYIRPHFGKTMTRAEHTIALDPIR